jgi:DNA-binding HxlR family transcriptional regulator
VAHVGDRWALLVVGTLLDGPARFADLERRIPGLAPNVLSRRLKALEAAGVVVATPYSTRPPRLRYELTAAGRELAGVLRLLARWGAARSSGAAEGPHHRACGTPVEARWWCPTCDEPVDDPDTDDLVHA